MNSLCSGVFAVILAGGAGTRFWPKSREAAPKQLMPMGGGPTLLQHTAMRLESMLPPQRILVSTNKDYVSEVLRQLPLRTPAAVIAEPFRRDTGPAVALAAATVAARTGDGRTLLVFAPSDHWIQDDAAFRRTLMTALAAAAEPGMPLVTVGVPPARPETGFGYIETGKTTAHYFGWPALAVKRFVEKPGRRTAARFMRGGRHLWNSGILVCAAAAILGALQVHEPAIGDLLPAVEAALRDAGEAALAEAYARMPVVSIDHAVLEKAPNVMAVPAQFGWDDMGSWGALARVTPLDRDGNLAFGPVLALGASGCIVDAGRKPVCLLGVKDLIVVDAGDVVLVADRGRDQDIGLFRDRLERAGLGRLL